jgi:hypothetical protein
MKKRVGKYIEITRAKHLAGHKIRLEFNDGEVRVVDFGPFLRRTRHPDLTKYRHATKFKRFHLHHGDLMWGDFEMIFPIADLHKGEIG